jgi:hypothetical protein
MSARAWSRAVAMSRVARSREASASAWAWRRISVALAWASRWAWYRIARTLSAGLLGLQQAVFEVLFPIVERLDQRPPGELAEQGQQAQEDDERPDGQRRLRLHRV